MANCENCKNSYIGLDGDLSCNSFFKCVNGSIYQPIDNSKLKYFIDNEITDNSISINKENKIDVGKNIEKYRKQHKISQLELSELMEKPLKTIQKYESNEIIPSHDNIYKLAKCLDISTDKLIGEADVWTAEDIIKTEQKEMVNHPSHYNMGKYEAIDVIEGCNLGFNLGNTVKYISRAGHKDDIIQDLKKARWYLDREIQRLSKKGE